MGALNDNNLSIDYEKVAQDAGNINQCAVKMDNILNNFSTKMQDLKRKEIIVEHVEAISSYASKIIVSDTIYYLFNRFFYRPSARSYRVIYLD